MITDCKKNVTELKNLLITLNDDEYCKRCELLSGATIGQHIRHILEFYICLLNGHKKGVICYDDRKRDVLLETNCATAVRTIEKLCMELGNLTMEEELILESNFEKNLQRHKTSTGRELQYCLEHSIHHQAMIKVALHELEVSELVTSEFGLAPSTKKFRKSKNQA